MAAPRVAALFALGMNEAWSAEAISGSTAARGGRLLLLQDEGELVGALLLRVEGEDAEVLQVAVHPERRRAGAGRQLLRAGEAAAIEAGASRCFLEVRASNQAARALYESAGYAEVGLRAGYYRDGEDAHVLSRDLLPPPLG